MKTILVLAAHPDFADVIRSGLNPEEYRIVHRADAQEAEPLLAHCLANACIVDLELLGVQGIWAIEKLRRHNDKCPVIAYTPAKKSEWEEEAYLHGVTHVLSKPVRLRLLTALLDRLLLAPAPRAIQTPLPLPAAPPAAPPGSRLMDLAPARFAGASQTLGVLRDFSSILTHSLNAEPMLKQFLLFLREILGVNRAAIFLNHPCSPLLETPPAEDSQRLRIASAIGIAPGLLEHFELSLDRAWARNWRTWDAFSGATATKRVATPRRRRNLNCSARKLPCPFSTGKPSSASLSSTGASRANRW